MARLKLRHYNLSSIWSQAELLSQCLAISNGHCVGLSVQWMLLFLPSSAYSLLLALFYHASVSWFFYCSLFFFFCFLSLSSDPLHSFALLLPVCWDGSRTAGSVLQSSVSGFNIPIQSPLAVFSHPARAGTLSLTLLMLLSFFTTFYFISQQVLGYMCLTCPFSCPSSELGNVQEKKMYLLICHGPL